LAFWTGQLHGGASRGAVAAGIANSQEAMTAQSTATSAVFLQDAAGTTINSLYHTAFGREADAADETFWKAALQHGITPAQIATDLAQSHEFAADHQSQNAGALINSLYELSLDRAADSAGAAFYTAAGQSGLPGLGAILLDLAQARTAQAAPLSFQA
jgi:hypothetical protein